MPSLPRLGSLPSTDRLLALPSRDRVVRGAARGALLVAILAGTSAFAAQAGGSSAGSESAPSDSFTAAIAASTGTDARGLFGAEASRSEARAPLDVVASIRVDGEVLPVTAGAETVADALENAGVVLGSDDVVSLPLIADVPDGAEIVVSRVVYTQATERVEVPFSVTEQPDGSLPVGQRVVVTAGQPGTEVVLYTVRMVDGVEESREETLRTGTQPVAEVARVGAEPRSIARAMVAARGWGEEQFACLDRLWTKESNWNPSAQNASSGAYGIPQSLPGSKMGTVAADWRTNPATQITWGLNYIEGRYGSPCGAWSHSQAVNWY